jgi:hypothetical protein
MKARVATWRGGDPEAIKRNLDEIRSRAESGPPEGVPSVGLMVLQRDDEVMFIGRPHSRVLRRADQAGRPAGLSRPSLSPTVRRIIVFEIIL